MFNDYEVLQGAGSISQKAMEQIVRERYLAFDARRKAEDAAQADRDDLAELENMEKMVAKRKKGAREQ